MIFVDSNIPMYLVGADHPLRTEAQEPRVAVQARYRQVLHQGLIPRPPRWAARRGQGRRRVTARGKCTKMACLPAIHSNPFLITPRSL